MALVVAIESFTTIMCIVLWFFSQKQGQWTENAPTSMFCVALRYSVTYHLGTVMVGSFMVAVIWTLITMITVYKEAIKSLMSHEKLEPIRDYIIACAIWCLKKLKDCVEFGNNLA